MSTAREDDVARGAEGAPRADVAVPDRATEAKGGEALPAPTPEDGAGTRVVRVGSGVAVPIGEERGPVVVNADGSLSSIANWDEMTDREREATRRRIAKRNNARLEALKAAGGDEREGEARRRVVTTRTPRAVRFYSILSYPILF